MKSKINQSRGSMGRRKKGVLLPVTSPVAPMPDNYQSFLADLKQKIVQERLRVVISSNAALVKLYWDIGQSILKKQNDEPQKSVKTVIF